MASVSPACRHAEFYKPDGNLVIQVQSTLYRVHISTIEERSVIFASTLSVPQPDGIGSPREGSCDEHPFVMPLEACADFEALLAWFYPRSYREMKTLYSSRDYLISLLKMASRYDVEDALALAQDRLESTPSFTAPFMLHYARRLDIPAWRERAAHALLHVDLLSLSHDDIELIGLPTYKALVDLRGDIDSHRRYVACVMPTPAHYIICRSKRDCDAGFTKVWGIVREFLLRPEGSLSLPEIFDRLEGVESSGMDMRCFNIMLCELKKDAAFGRESALKATVLKRIRSSSPSFRPSLARSPSSPALALISHPSPSSPAPIFTSRRATRPTTPASCRMPRTPGAGDPCNGWGPSGQVCKGISNKECKFALCAKCCCERAADEYYKCRASHHSRKYKLYIATQAAQQQPPQSAGLPVWTSSNAAPSLNQATAWPSSAPLPPPSQGVGWPSSAPLPPPSQGVGWPSSAPLPPPSQGVGWPSSAPLPPTGQSVDWLSSVSPLPPARPPLPNQDADWSPSALPLSPAQTAWPPSAPVPSSAPVPPSAPVLPSAPVPPSAPVLPPSHGVLASAAPPPPPSQASAPPASAQPAASMAPLSLTQRRMPVMAVPDPRGRLAQTISVNWANALAGEKVKMERQRIEKEREIEIGQRVRKSASFVFWTKQGERICCFRYERYVGTYPNILLSDLPDIIKALDLSDAELLSFRPSTDAGVPECPGMDRELALQPPLLKGKRPREQGSPATANTKARRLDTDLSMDGLSLRSPLLSRRLPAPEASLFAPRSLSIARGALSSPSSLTSRSHPFSPCCFHPWKLSLPTTPLAFTPPPLAFATSPLAFTPSPLAFTPSPLAFAPSSLAFTPPPLKLSSCRLKFSPLVYASLLAITAPLLHT
ncbi:hypothetical protein BOTBODRAFT_176709 [Botryobasidium botryosum FD-172 SS1]|uniref:BTB domain-containing protein n=1 Tax=Botryobasidium botryosum (strain FD-172 SS1) TaxID=930990 RepID=A0A067MJX3_BOTB1|nr:hypothetical protein BOTBODRAFT_176709 [Botryobasidium botryosum FD-172 SS1]